MSSLLTLAQVGMGGFTFMHYLIIIIGIAAAVGIVLVITRAMGVAIPGWVIQVFWILLAVVVGIIAIKFIFSIM